MPATLHHERFLNHFALVSSAILRATALLFVVLWIQSWVYGVGVDRLTIVESGPVIQATDPTEIVSEYISHTRHVSSSRGRLHFVYMRGEELNKSKDLPRRVTWRGSAGRGGGVDRYDAPQWMAAIGFDWKFRSAEGGRPNGEYWSNRSTFLYVPYWPLFLLTAVGGWGIGRRSRLVRRRIKRGLCPKCGYDIRATPQQCPECGNVPYGH